MAICPRCGNEVANPVKTWPISSRNPAPDSQLPRLVVGIFECPKCKARFRAAVDSVKVEERTNISDMVERVKGIKGELLQTLKNLRERIHTLETQRSDLMVEIENLRKVAESRARALESEVGMLKEEMKTLKDLLGYTEEPNRL